MGARLNEGGLASTYETIFWTLLSHRSLAPFEEGQATAMLMPYAYTPLQPWATRLASSFGLECLN